MQLVFADEMRRIDQAAIEDFGLPGRVLMENAGRGATRWFLDNFSEALSQRIGVLAGRGNNGGDGFVMARYLFQKGAQVTVFLLADKARVTGDAAANLELIDKLGVPVVCIEDDAAWQEHHSSLVHQQIWIDALLGTGLKAEVRGLYKTAIDFMNQSGLPVFAVDIPSGLDADTGRPHGVCVQAQASATFGLAKPGQILFPGAEYTGKLKIIDIGIPPHVVETVNPQKWLLTAEMVSSQICPRGADSHKGDNGHLLTVAGAVGATGAAAMTAMAGLRAGAGLVTLAIPAGINHILEPMVVEAMTLPVGAADSTVFDDAAVDDVLEKIAGKTCVAIGPGIGTGPGAEKLVRTIVKQSTVPVVIDADGLNCLASDPDVLRQAGAPVIITPHPGEMGRLLGLATAQIQSDRIGCARNFALQYNVHTVLKGAATVIAHPDGRVFINRTGNPGMASGGMGDVLTGLIAGLVSQQYAAGAAACLGVYLHGAAADILAEHQGPQGFLASEVMDAVPVALAEIMNHGTPTNAPPETDHLA